MKKLLLYLMFVTCTNMAAQQLNFIPAPVGYGTNSTCDNRAMVPFFKDDSYIYCSTYKIWNTAPVTYIIRVSLSDGSQFVYTDLISKGKVAFNGKKLNQNIFFEVDEQLWKINTSTNKISNVSTDADVYEVFDHYLIYVNKYYTPLGTFIVDLNTNVSTEIKSPNNQKLCRLGSVYYDNGVLYFRSEWTSLGMYHAFYKYVPATKSITEIVGRNVVSGSNIYQERDEFAKVNDNLVFLMRDTDYNMKYFSVNLTTQTLNTSFTFDTKQVYETFVNDLMVFNDTVYITSLGKVYVSDGANTLQQTNYPQFIGIGNSGYSDKVIYLNSIAYLQLSTPEYGLEIWKYDGTENDKQLVKDISCGSGSSFVGYRNGFIQNNRIIYYLTKGPFAGSLYATDGTSEGTVCILDNTHYDKMSNFFPDNDTLYFYGENATNKGLFGAIAVMTNTATPIAISKFDQVAPICAGSTPTALPTTSANGITGAWSPALNNTSTTQYTFTPTDGQCAATAVMTVPVTEKVTPTFTQVDAICSGATLAALPTTSNNGISGTWSPAVRNTSTTLYTFTPSTGQCGTTTTMTIIVNGKITPTFTPVDAICSGATLDALPTTSINGISGTWSPALKNTATTKYTFTPTTGQCANAANMTITVNNNTSSTFTQVDAICSGESLSPLPLTSNEGISGTWSPALNNTTTTDYTFTPSTGQCINNGKMTITINPIAAPTFTPVAPICLRGSLSALPVTSNNGISGTWSPALNNTATTEYTFTPSAGQCASDAKMTIAVNDIVTPSFTEVAAICAGATLPVLPVTSNNGISGTWSPALNNTSTTEYAFTPLAGQCGTATTMTITVNDIVTPSFTEVAAICSGGSLSALPITSNNGISGIWSPALNNITTTNYTFTPATGQCASTADLTISVNEKGAPTFTQVDAICSGGFLSALPVTSNNGISGTWSPELNNTATTNYTFIPTTGQCASTAGMTISVNDKIAPTFTPVDAICSGGFLSALPVTSNNGILGTWAPALNNTATTNYTFTPTTGQCASMAGMTISVNDKVAPTFTQVDAICWGGSLSALPITSNNGISGTWSPALNNTATTNYLFTPSTGQCASTADMTISVNDKVAPTFTPVDAICSGGFLSALPVTSNNGILGTWAPALNNTATTNYTFTPTTGQCASTAGMTISVNDKVAPAFTQVDAICSGGFLPALPVTSNNGISGMWSPALNNTASTNYTFTPTTGQCASTADMTISVNDKVAPTFTQVDAICSGGSLSALPVTSNNGISGTWAPVLNNIATTNYTFIPATGQCASMAGMTISVNEIPTAPIAAAQQILGSGSKVESLKAQGSNLKWYLSENATTELDLNTVLTNGVYYVSQTTNSCESNRTAVTVTLTALGIDDFNDSKISINAFPNPFKDSFSIEISGENQEAARISIYDMLGKLIEKRELSPDEISVQVFGANYSKGIYNIIVNQSGKVKTLRMIKG